MNKLIFITSYLLMLLYVAPITISASEFLTHYEICDDACSCCSDESNVEKISDCCQIECSYEVHQVPEIPIAYTTLNSINFNIVFSIIQIDLPTIDFLNKQKNSNINQIESLVDVCQNKIFKEQISSQYFSSSLI